MSASDSQFRARLLGRLLRAAGASSTGLLLAAACAGRSERHEPGSGSGGQLSAGGAASSGSGGRASGGTAGSATSGSGGFAATGGVIFIEPLDAGEPDGGALTLDGGSNMRICFAFSGQSHVVTSGTGGDAPCRGAAGGGGGLDGAAGNAAGSGGTAAMSGGGEGGEPSVTCPDPSTLPELAGYQCSLCGGLRSYGWERIANVGTPSVVDGACCYDLLVRQTECVYVGRAFLVDDGLVRSSVRAGGGWQFGPAPDVQKLSRATRDALAEAWLKDAAFEHASVATFARFALQLLTAGAPAELLHATLAAGNDEVRHAELCFTLASAYAGTALEPDAFPLGDTLPLQRELTEIVAETIVEGCIGETLAALQAQAQLAITTDPAVLESLRATVEDETRHAELAWRVTAWALAVGGPAVRRIAERAFAEFEPPKAPVIELDGVDLIAFAAHGRLTPDTARAVALEALALVVRPCAAALLERDVMSHLERRAAPRASGAEA